MVTAENITRVGEKIILDVLLEDSKTPIKMMFDINKSEFEPFSFPNGYEYCTEHIAKLKRFLNNVIKNNEKLPKTKTIAWY